MTQPQVRAQPPDTPWAEGPLAPLRPVLNFMTSLGEVLKRSFFNKGWTDWVKNGHFSQQGS